MGHGNAAVAAIRFENRFHAIELTVLLLTFQQVKHTFYQVIDVQQLQFCTPIIDRKRFIVGNRPAEGADGAVILGAAVAHQVHKAVDRHLCPNLLSILEEQFLASLLAATILAVAKTTSQRSLNGGGQHDGRLVIVLF